MWNIEAQTGYKPITNYWDDFTAAERHGEPYITDTYKAKFNECKDDVKKVTELVLVLNWKIWQYAKPFPSLGKIYDKLWRTCAAWCESHLKGTDLDYYYSTTD